MKEKLSKTKAGITTILFCVFVLLLTSCKRELDTSNSQSNKATIQLAVLRNGFDTSGIKDLGSYVLVEGDILLPKATLLTLPRQAYQNNNSLINRTKQNNITVVIDNSVPSNGGNLDWRNEVTQAITEYNNLGGYIKFSIVSGTSADITIRVGLYDPTYNQYMGTNVIAAAGLPSNGLPFNTVVINSNYGGTPSSSTKKYNLVHELGHCIGFRHTNWYGLGEPGAIGIGNSPNSGNNPDASSVYNGGTALNSWNGFSSWDKYAITYFYGNFSASISGFPTTPVSGQQYYVSVGANMPISTYSWWAGGGYISGSTTGSSANAVCGSPYTFTVGCTVTNQYGESLSLQKWVP